MNFKENDLLTLRYVKAGQAGKVLTLTSQDISNKEFTEETLELINVHDGDMFIVIGESMAPEFIHTGNILLVEACDSFELSYGDFVILEVDGKQQNFLSKVLTGNCNFGYKLRKFISVLDISSDADSLFEKSCMIDIETNFDKEQNKAVFFDKLVKARARIPKEEYAKVLLSVTYTETGRDFSFHASRDLCAKVTHVLCKNKEGKYVENANVNR